jgi:hypothetical protein
MDTLDKFIEFNDFRKPIFIAWGIVGLVGDSAICFSRECIPGEKPRGKSQAGTDTC